MSTGGSISMPVNRQVPLLFLRPSEHPLDLCIHLTWLQQWQCCTGTVTGRQRELAASCCFTEVACRAQAGTCATHTLPGERGMAWGTCNSWLGQGSTPSPFQQRCQTRPVCPSCRASSMLTSPSVAESFPVAGKGLQHLICSMVEVSPQYSDPWGCYSHGHSYF